MSQRKLIKKDKKRNLYNLVIFKQFVKCKKAKTPLKLVEVYVPRKFSEDSSTWMAREDFVKMSVTFPIIFKRKKQQKYKDISIKPGYSFKLLLDS